MSYQKFLVGRVYFGALTRERKSPVYLCPVDIVDRKMFARLYVFNSEFGFRRLDRDLLIFPGKTCEVVISPGVLSLASGVCAFDESCLLEVINETKA